TIGTHGLNLLPRHLKFKSEYLIFGGNGVGASDPEPGQRAKNPLAVPDGWNLSPIHGARQGIDVPATAGKEAMRAAHDAMGRPEIERLSMLGACRGLGRAPFGTPWSPCSAQVSVLGLGAAEPIHQVTGISAKPPVRRSDRQRRWSGRIAS